MTVFDKDIKRLALFRRRCLPDFFSKNVRITFLRLRVNAHGIFQILKAYVLQQFPPKANRDLADYNKNARQCIIGEEIMPARPWGSRGRRPRDPQGLEGIIFSPIMHWRAFFILFHHI